MFYVENENRRERCFLPCTGSHSQGRGCGGKNTPLARRDGVWEGGNGEGQLPLTGGVDQT